MPDIFRVTCPLGSNGSATERRVKFGQLFKRDTVFISFKGVIVIKQFNNRRRCRIVIIYPFSFHLDFYSATYTYIFQKRPG